MQSIISNTEIVSRAFSDSQCGGVVGLAACGSAAKRSTIRWSALVGSPTARRIHGTAVGVIIIAVFQFFIAALLILLAAASALGIGVLGAILARSREMGAPAFLAMAGAGAFVAAVVLVFAALFGTLGFGMWNLREWARLVTIVLSILGTVGAAIGLLWALAHFRPIGLFLSSIRLAINLTILWYLSRPQVRDAFRLPPASSARAAD